MYVLDLKAIFMPFSQAIEFKEFGVLCLRQCVKNPDRDLFGD